MTARRNVAKSVGLWMLDELQLPKRSYLFMLLSGALTRWVGLGASCVRCSLMCGFVLLRSWVWRTAELVLRQAVILPLVFYLFVSFVVGGDLAIPYGSLTDLYHARASVPFIRGNDKTVVADLWCCCAKLFVCILLTGGSHESFSGRGAYSPGL